MFDRYQRKIEYVRISLTDRCNLRCRYCMPDGAKIPEHEEVLTHDEFLRLAALFAQCGHRVSGDNLVHKVDNFLYTPSQAAVYLGFSTTHCNIGCGKTTAA